MLQRQRRRPGAIAGVQLGEDIADMDADGPRAERQSLGDLLVRLALERHLNGCRGTTGQDIGQLVKQTGRGLD